MKYVLLTGANGFIATHIARALLSRADVMVFALVRAKNPEDAKAKLLREWWDYPELTAALNVRIQAVSGDVTQPNLGMPQEQYRDIAGKVTHIIHTAADWRLLPLDELRKTNVQGTANIIEFAKQTPNIERLSHISTAYVAGGATGTVSEEQLTDQYGFATDYERSKYEGEQLISSAKTQLPISVFRPSMVVGDSQTGAIKTFNTFYFPLRLYLTGRMRLLPVSRSLRLNIVPVDYVANAVVQLTFDPKAVGKTFHTVAPYETLPRLGEVMDYVQKWAKTELDSKLAKPIFLPMSPSQLKVAIKIQKAFSGDRKVFDALISLSPYFSENRRFDRSNIDSLLGAYRFHWQEVMPRLLTYAVYNSFFHRSDRTVHEQVLFRLESQRYLVTYYDIIEGRLVKKSAQEMRQDILAAASALKGLGIGAGDRVAITGLNSTKYLAVDIAIGLVGAISVPLYYTTPPADINDVLLASGAKLFFVGMPSLLSRAKEFTRDVPIVSICRTPAPGGIEVTSWDEFLSKAQNISQPVKAPVGFGDIATLRYSSGTTGKPKGAIFCHDNLRYMAESIVSITPWKARNRSCSYLSFLPMGHVVEGILATYAPYYIPAPVTIYFLEDFRRLQSELPRIKPTIFFSVPRVYEKVWEVLEKNSIGKKYVYTKSRLLKAALRRTVRNITLKRAGLNKCAQLIVGSASCSDELLENYRRLGVEIYNAYGLTEAPLITLNRLRRNRLGTVGEPMPFTEVKTAEDGEIMVRGPQVTAGYFDQSLTPPFKDGWLMTGDIGQITPEGSLIIYGRKKELIKTSYGKCIYQGKIEGMIRELPQVNEALVLGESKPYCTALTWVDKNHYNQATFDAVDRSMEEMNLRLSNPEKIKCWAILPNNLSIERGELTPNLKLKRNVVSQNYASIISSLYTGVPLEGAVHFGGMEQGE